MEDAVARGASVLVGGKAEGRCFQPTLLANVPDEAVFAREETFGPVAAVEVVEDADEAVRRANSTSYGLSAGILTGNPSGAWPRRKLQSGIVHVNDQRSRRATDAVRGVKDSGWGRFRGAAVDEFRLLDHRPERPPSFPF